MRIHRLSKDHTKSAHNKKFVKPPGPYKCDHPGCNKSYAEKSKLKKHLKKRHSIETKTIEKKWNAYTIDLKQIENPVSTRKKLVFICSFKALEPERARVLLELVLGAALSGVL